MFFMFPARPETSIYSKDDVVPGVKNVLICYVTGLFPPPVIITWTKNDVNVTENINQSQYRLKSDGTFNVFSTLRFTPEEGDIYSCSVYHKALEDKYITRTWGENQWTSDLLYDVCDITSSHYDHVYMFQKLMLLCPVLVQLCSVE